MIKKLKKISVLIFMASFAGVAFASQQAVTNEEMEIDLSGFNYVDTALDVYETKEEYEKDMRSLNGIVIGMVPGWIGYLYATWDDLPVNGKAVESYSVAWALCSLVPGLLWMAVNECHFWLSDAGEKVAWQKRQAREQLETILKNFKT